MLNRLIKSQNRLQKYGEVFTPSKTINKMLNQPEIQEKINKLDATFFEPSAGEGAFLVELLKKRLDRAVELSNNKNQFTENALIGLSSLYGVELLQDDFNMLIQNMIHEFKTIYINDINKFKYKISDKFIKKVFNSAITIIKANILNGDTLKRIDIKGNPLIFSEWKMGHNHKVQRTEYTLDSIINDEGPIGTATSTYSESLNLFNLPDENDNLAPTSYKPVNIIDVYKEETI